MKGRMVPRGVDAVDEYIERLSEDDPDSAVFIADYESNEELIQALIEAREVAGVSQRQLAKAMGTSPSVVVHMEAGHSDPRQSTVARYAAALGKILRWELVDYPATQSLVSRPADAPPHHYVSGDPSALLPWEPIAVVRARLVAEELKPTAQVVARFISGTELPILSPPSSCLAA